jgi:1,4-dihydroxy-2-naphthoate octaprenyltransferase
VLVGTAVGATTRPATRSVDLLPHPEVFASVDTSYGIHVVWSHFVLAVVVALAVQVAVTFANDYFDGTRGVDTVLRAGPTRAVATGLVSPQRMLAATFAAMAVAAAAGIALAALVSWWLLLIGAAAFVALLGYSGGPRPYASAGLGELFVFLFFGLAATLGSAYVQHERLTLTAWLCAIATGLLAVALLVVNNLRDVPTDAVAGKRTLAVRLGDARTRQLFVALVVVALLIAVVGVPLAANSLWPVLAVLAVPLALEPLRAVRGGGVGRALVPALGGIGRLELATAVLLAAGLLAHA